MALYLSKYLMKKKNNYGYGEPSPYIANIKSLHKNLKFIFFKYFKDQNYNNINFVEIKKKCKNINHKKIISCFQQAILDLSSKRNNISLEKFIGKKKLTKLDFMAVEE